MSDMRGAVQQQARSVSNDGSRRDVTVNRGGDLTVAQQVDRWLREGRVWEAHFATEGGTATIEQNASIDMTEPFFRLTIPSSMAFVPLRVVVSNQSVWTTADAIVMWTSDTDTYNTGGAAPDVRCLFQDNQGTNQPRTSACTSVFDGDSVLTENALTNARQLDVKHFVTGGLFNDYVWSALNGGVPIYIHGPGSFGLTCKLGAAGTEVLYSVIWAELDKAELTNS